MKQELHGSKTNCQTRLDIVNNKFRKSSTLFGLPLNDGISDIFLIRNTDSRHGMKQDRLKKSASNREER